MKLCNICNTHKSLDDFYTNGKTPKGSIKYKPECKTCFLDIKQKFVKIKQDRLDEVFGTCCIVCGYNRCRNALDFHHVDPLKKEHKPTAIIRNFMTVDNMLEELKNCVLLCSNCHREFHAGFITLPKRDVT